MFGFILLIVIVALLIFLILKLIKKLKKVRMDLPKWLGNLCSSFGYKEIYIKKEKGSGKSGDNKFFKFHFFTFLFC
ncbi:hypothetical protein MCOL2_09436 [Listeria fleischmannii FSL S10-1203]|uniref:Uncharacterized protein n=1 Tax=Listeria fleischmannii FSL S10-1203 TaxID=1265822 RepID=W7DN29_9LIST|nr:hypothetical protein MCOL2_09436 [Listeria fleischmannii FSL S10-1203]